MLAADTPITNLYRAVAEYDAVKARIERAASINPHAGLLVAWSATLNDERLSLEEFIERERVGE